MAGTDDTQPIDMNALLRNREDRDVRESAWHARLFGTTDTGTDTDTTSDTTDGGDSAA